MHRHFVVEQQGVLLNVKRMLFETTKVESYSSRGGITTFSAKSRKRLIERFARMDAGKMRKKRTLFLTLTYPKLQLDYKVAKRDLKAFAQRIQRKFPKAWLVWRMEEQLTGSIHFHLILGNVGYWNVVDAQNAWCEVTKTTARNSLDLSVCKTQRHVMHYVSKYVAKTLSGDIKAIARGSVSTMALLLSSKMSSDAVFILGLSMCHIFPHVEKMTGRHWGIYGRDNVPYAKKRYAILSGNAYTQIVAIAMMNSRYANFWQNWTLFDEKAHQKFIDFCDVFYGARDFLKALESRSKQYAHQKQRFIDWFDSCVRRANEITEQKRREKVLRDAYDDSGLPEKEIGNRIFRSSLPVEWRMVWDNLEYGIAFADWTHDAASKVW